MAPGTSGRSKGDEKWSDSRDTLQEKLKVFSDKLYMEYERRKSER